MSAAMASASIRAEQMSHHVDHSGGELAPNSSSSSCSISDHEFKQLDYNAPLLSVRRLKLSESGADAVVADTGGCKDEASPRMLLPQLENNLSCWKLSSELSRMPIRLPGAIPFEWEHSPGRPKLIDNMTYNLMPPICDNIQQTIRGHNLSPIHPDSPPAGAAELSNSAALFKDKFCVVESLTADTPKLDGAGEDTKCRHDSTKIGGGSDAAAALQPRFMPQSLPYSAARRSWGRDRDAPVSLKDDTSIPNSDAISTMTTDLVSFECLSNGAAEYMSYHPKSTAKNISAAAKLMRAYSTKCAPGTIISTSVGSCKARWQQHRHLSSKEGAVRDGRRRRRRSSSSHSRSQNVGSYNASASVSVMLDSCTSRVSSLHLLREAMAQIFTRSRRRFTAAVSMPIAAPSASSFCRAAGRSSIACNGGNNVAADVTKAPQDYSGTAAMVPQDYSGTADMAPQDSAAAPSRDRRAAAAAADNGICDRASSLRQKRLGKRLWVDTATPTSPSPRKGCDGASSEALEEAMMMMMMMMKGGSSSGSSVPPHVYPGRCQRGKVKSSMVEAEAVGWPLGISGYPPRSTAGVGVRNPNPNPRPRPENPVGHLAVPLPPLPAPPLGGSWLKKALSSSPSPNVGVFAAGGGKKLAADAASRSVLLATPSSRPPPHHHHEFGIASHVKSSSWQAGQV